MDELFILTDGGQLIFSWHSKDIERDPNKDDDLIGGFLTAINSFVTLERGEDIKTLKLKESTIIFEKFEELHQKLIFVATTKNDELIELSHSMIHDSVHLFNDAYKDVLSREFSGEVSQFSPFTKTLEGLYHSYGLNDLKDSLISINEDTPLKSVVYIEPKAGHIFYLHAKQHMNREKLSFLIPLIINSAQLLYQNHLGENIRWILLNTVRNENIMVEARNKILLVKQYQLENKYEEDILALEFFKEKDKYVKKPKKLVSIFENLIFDSKIKQVFLVDLLGKILFSKILDPTNDCSEYIPETISFLTSTKKASEEIYNRVLFNASIGGISKYTTICINFNNFALTLIGDTQELNDFKTIQDICSNILVQLL